MDDKEETGAEDSSGVSKIYEKLINDGRAGGKQIIKGSLKTLINAINRTINYRLIILDNIFVSKGHETQTRMCQEWATFINDNVKIPVLSLSEIRSKYRFSIKEFIQLVFLALLVVVTVFLIFQFDEQILSFLSQKELNRKIIATICVFVFIPFFAYSYSKLIRLILKMIKFD